MTKIIMLAAVMLAVCAVAEPIRIMPIGDSITQGGKTSREEYTYRWPLFCKLVDENVDFDFVGSRKFGLQKAAKWPEEYKGHKFDPDHEGYYGIKTADALKALQTAQTNWVAAPDLALIHLGTNDQKAEDHKVAVQDPLREIILLLRKQNPNVVILLGHLNFNYGVAPQKIRPLVEELAKEMNTEKSPVITVAHYKGWKERPTLEDTDTFDWAHPNAKGQKKMADAWYEAMKPYLEIKNKD